VSGTVVGVVPLNAERAPRFLAATRLSNNEATNPSQFTYNISAYTNILSAVHIRNCKHHTMSSKDAPESSDEITGQSALPSE